MLQRGGAKASYFDWINTNHCSVMGQWMFEVYKFCGDNAFNLRNIPTS